MGQLKIHKLMNASSRCMTLTLLILLQACSDGDVDSMDMTQLPIPSCTGMSSIPIPFGGKEMMMVAGGLSLVQGAITKGSLGQCENQVGPNEVSNVHGRIADLDRHNARDLGDISNLENCPPGGQGCPGTGLTSPAEILAATADSHGLDPAAFLKKKTPSEFQGGLGKNGRTRDGGAGGGGGSAGGGSLAAGATSPDNALGDGSGEDPSLHNKDSGAGYQGGGDRNPAKGKEDDKGLGALASLFGGKGNGAGNADGVGGKLQFGRGPASKDGTNPMGTEDPSDYFSRIDVYANIFKIVERRYRTKSMSWALESADDLLKQKRPMQ